MSDKKKETPSRSVYTSTCRLVVEGFGQVLPDNAHNRKLDDVTTTCVLTETEAARYGESLVKLRPANDGPQRLGVQNKQVTEADMRTK